MIYSLRHTGVVSILQHVQAAMGFQLSKLALALLGSLVAILACVSAPGVTVTAEEYGDEWPLTVSSARLLCYQDMVWVVTQGYSHPVNGTAMGRLSSEHTDKSIRDIKRIWAYDEEFNQEWESLTGENPGMRIGIGALIQDGLALC